MVWMPNALASAFADQGVDFDEKSNYIIAKTSLQTTDEKIKQIVLTSGFYPLFPVGVREGCFVFTIAPLRVPGFFLHSVVAEHFNRDEIAALLEPRKFLGEPSGALPKDRWIDVNYFRKLVAPSLNRGISEILLSRMKEGQPIVEIGSGIGYELDEKVSSQTIRIQPNLAECQLLSNSISGPIYQMNVEELYHLLMGTGKKLPFVFSINTFDAMSRAKRKLNLSRISELQMSKGSMLFMLDTNPCFNDIVDELMLLYPGLVPLPYFPRSSASTKISFMMVAQTPVTADYSGIHLADLLDSERDSIDKGVVSKLQLFLREIVEPYAFPVVVVEDFFVAQMKADLEEVGYKVSSYYHTSFTVAELPKDWSVPKYELIYKAVTDARPYRQWALDDRALSIALNEKAIALPLHFDKAFVDSIRASNERILGAEILVIEAIKI